jgi:two-component system, sensor histidine kinase RegB
LGIAQSLSAMQTGDNEVSRLRRLDPSPDSAPLPLVRTHGAPAMHAARANLADNVTPAHQSLRLLAVLRSLAVPVQALATWVAVHQAGLQFRTNTVYMLIVLQAAFALLTWLRLWKHRAPVEPREVLMQVHADIALFGAVLYFAGGTTNPFAPMLAMPLVAAASLPRAWMWLTATSTVVTYLFLLRFNIPMNHPLGIQEVFRLHSVGDQFSYLITTATLAYFVHKMMASQKAHERTMADVRERQMRDDTVLSIGAFAAGCAHELSSPLTTMSVVVKELQREGADPQRLADDLRILEQQVAISKDIVTKFTGAAGRRRADAVAAVRADEFIECIVAKARALHPTATISLTLGRALVAPTIVSEETLRQAIGNLIDNAVHACPIDVQVSADWEGSDFTITVRDHGPGFPPEAMHKLGRVIFSTKGPSHGSGLGVMLTQVTVNRLGGSLSLSNPPGGGACAQMRLPLNDIRL